jgi:hypothetical protein
LQKNGFSAEFFGSAQEALAAAQSKALDLLVSDLTSSGDFGDDCATQMRVLTTNSGEEIDDAYQEERLLALLHRRQKLPATSNQIPDLEVEILAIWDLVRSYRMVQARQHCEAALEPIEASSKSFASHPGGRRKELRQSDSQERNTRSTSGLSTTIFSLIFFRPHCHERARTLTIVNMTSKRTMRTLGRLAKLLL